MATKLRGKIVFVWAYSSRTVPWCDGVRRKLTLGIAGELVFWRNPPPPAPALVSQPVGRIPAVRFSAPRTVPQ